MGGPRVSKAACLGVLVEMYVQAQVIELTEPSSVDAIWSGIQIDRHRVKNLTAQETLFIEGDNAEFVYEVLDGAVCCYRQLLDGRRQVFSFSYPGDLIGLVQGDAHRYNSDALCPTCIRCIPRHKLLRTAYERPEVAEKLLQYATSELAVMQDHLVMLAQKSATEKVASFLLALPRRHANEQTAPVIFNLPMMRIDIADYLGLTIETVSRNLTKLKIAGIIDLSQDGIVVVHDIRRLERMAKQE
jgi:CRP-like cAMP-binding protein